MAKLRITSSCWLDSHELQFSYIRAPGPGGQNVNKVATAVQLRWNILDSSSLTETVRTRLLSALKHRLTRDGDLVIKASRLRTQERNRQDALQRLLSLLQHSATPPKPRKKTKPTRSSVHKRLETKSKQGKLKSLRRKVSGDH